MKVKSEREVTQSCPTLRHPMDWGSSVHGIFQTRVLEWDAIAFSIDKMLSYVKLQQSGKRNKILTHATKWLNLEDIKLREISQIQMVKHYIIPVIRLQSRGLLRVGHD